MFPAAGLRRVLGRGIYAEFVSCRREVERGRESGPSSDYQCIWQPEDGFVALDGNSVVSLSDVRKCEMAGRSSASGVVTTSGSRAQLDGRFGHRFSSVVPQRTSPGSSREPPRHSCHPQGGEEPPRADAASKAAEHSRHYSRAAGHQGLLCEGSGRSLKLRHSLVV